jgi:hypothetical protein
VDGNEVWNMLLYLSKNGDINESIQKHFTPILIQRTQTVSFETFKRYNQLAKECLKQMKDENRQTFLKILEAVLNAFLHKQLNDEHYSYRYTESVLKELLNITLELSTTYNLQHPSCLLIIRNLLFKLDTHTHTKPRKIKCLFERLNNFDQSLCETNDPADIIQDDWLTGYTFYIPQDWWTLSKDDYQSLCSMHRNNGWTIHCWSRLIYLSLLKSDITKPNEILEPLNQWMFNVGHDFYNDDDTLTIIFVRNIFETVIVKHIKSILCFPNIGSIIQYILHARENQSHLIAIKQVNDFVQNVQQLLQDTLLLNGKSILKVK